MEITRHWRLKAQRYRLEGSTCPTCDQLIFPPRSVCHECTVYPTRIVSRVLPVFLESTNLLTSNFTLSSELQKG